MLIYVYVNVNSAASWTFQNSWTISNGVNIMVTKISPREVIKSNEVDNLEAVCKNAYYYKDSVGDIFGIHLLCCNMLPIERKA